MITIAHFFAARSTHFSHTVLRVAATLILMAISVESFSQIKPTIVKDDFFPFSVWYSGGKARATMLSTVTPQSKEEWRKDVQQIKALGFNSVKTWVEWSHCEPRKGQYNFENLK
ncbi:MAG TPA: beta-galactosidase, partial [Cyclobacteriaceae bacterium]